MAVFASVAVVVVAAAGDVGNEACVGDVGNFGDGASWVDGYMDR